MRERSSTAAPLLAALVCLLPLLYFGAYWLNLDNSIEDGTSSTIHFGPKYRVGGRAAEVFFWPAYAIVERTRTALRK